MPASRKRKRRIARLEALYSARPASHWRMLRRHISGGKFDLALWLAASPVHMYEDLVQSIRLLDPFRIISSPSSRTRG